MPPRIIGKRYNGINVQNNNGFQKNQRSGLDIYGLLEIIEGMGVVEVVAHKTGEASVCFVFTLVFLDKSYLSDGLSIFIQKLPDSLNGNAAPYIFGYLNLFANA